MNDKKQLYRNDLAILSCLRENSREKLTLISKRIRLPVSTIFDRLSAYKEFTRNTTLVDFSQLGFGAHVSILLKTAKAEREKVTTHLSSHPNVNSILRITNGYDYLIEGVFRTMTDVEDFIEKIEEQYTVKKKDVFYVLQDVRRETFLSNPETVKLVQ